MTDYNLSQWMERRSKDLGPYGDYLIRSVKNYEEDIGYMYATLYEISTSRFAGDEEQVMTAQRALDSLSLKSEHND